MDNSIRQWLHPIVISVLVKYKSHTGQPSFTTNDLHWVNREVEAYLPAVRRLLMENRSFTPEMKDYFTVLVESDLGTS
jgi:hypothetical protein